MRVVLLGSLLLVAALCGCCHAEKSTDGSRRCAFYGTLSHSKRIFYSVKVHSKSLPLESCTVTDAPGIRLAVRGDYGVLQGSRRAWTRVFSSLRLDLKCPNHPQGACVRLTFLGKGKHGDAPARSSSRSSTLQRSFSALEQSSRRFRRHAASRTNTGPFKRAEPRKNKESSISALNAFAASVLVMALVVCILACAKKSKKSDLDTETPLPNVIGTSSTEAAEEDSHLYDDAERAKASMPQEPEDNYEDLEAGKAAMVSNRNHAGMGLPPKRSSHNDLGVTKAKSSHVDMAVKHSLHRMDSAPPSHMVHDNRLPDMVPSFDRPNSSLQEDDEPPPPVPMKTEEADILYDVGPELARPQSPPSYKVQPPPPQVSNPPEPMLVSQASHVSKTIAMSVEASAWIQKQEKIDEDDGPPPALPPKTAEAEMIYGENIPLSLLKDRAAAAAAEKLQAPPQQPPPPQQQQQPEAQMSMSEAAKALQPGSQLTKQVNVTDEYDDDEAAPSLPPKTAGAEELYDYAENPDRPGGNPDRPGGNPDRPGGNPDRPGGNPDRPGGKPDRPGGNPARPVPPPKRATLACSVEQTQELSYTEVSFKPGESTPVAPPKPLLGVGIESVDTSVYADVSFQ